MSSTEETTNNNEQEEKIDDVDSFKGHCYCGKIKFEVHMTKDEKPLFPPVYCHCDSCRRAHSAPLYRVVCVDGGKHFTILQGEDLIQKFKKGDRPSGITRCFCKVCGSKIFNEFNPNLPFWPPGTTKPMVFFPDTLEADVAINLPEKFRPKGHNEVKECCLDLELIGKIQEQGGIE